MPVITVNSRDFHTKLTDEGIFSTDVDGEEFKHDTMKGLKALITHKLERSKIEVPVILYKGMDSRGKLTLQNAVIVGVHGRTGNSMIKIGDGPVHQLPGYVIHVLSPRTSLEILHKLAAKKMEAEQAFLEFLEDNRVDVKFMLQSEVGK